MEYHGFRSISEYERECARLSYKTRRIPFHDNNNGKSFALVTSCPGHPTGTSVESWTLFTADESARLLDGIISGGAFMHAKPEIINGKLEPGYLDENGVDKNWLGKLAAHGYRPDELQDAPAPAPTVPEYPTAPDGQICFLFWPRNSTLVFRPLLCYHVSRSTRKERVQWHLVRKRKYPTPGTTRSATTSTFGLPKSAASRSAPPPPRLAKVCKAFA